MMSNEEFAASVEREMNRLIKDVYGNMEEVCLRGKRYATQECPVDQGILRASIDYAVELEPTEIKGYLGSNEEYAPYVHQGTGIYAVDGNGRKTPWKYKVIAGKYKGWHVTEGQKPQPFLDKAVIKLKNEYSEILAGDK